jgi:spore maturation protein SpmA
MLNHIWLGLIVAAVILGGIMGQLKEVADKSLEMADVAVKTSFALIGVMALWLGIMRLAERAGLVALLARGLRPLMRRLFPEVPVEHPAMGSMLMNIAANMLGLGNAATPLGLRAMKHLEALNPHPGTATNAMCTFLAINTSGVQLIPVTAIAILAANKSVNPTAIVSTALLATTCAAVTGVTMCKLLARLPVFRQPVLADGRVVGAPVASPPIDEKPAVKEAASLHPLPRWGRWVMVGYLLFFGWLFLRMAFPESFGLALPAESAREPGYVRVLNSISRLSIPLLLSAFPLYAALRRVKVYEEFVEGAKEGFDVAVRIIPYLVAMLLAIGMFRAAGGIEWFTKIFRPLLDWANFPTELLPMALVRPLSGSGSLGIFTELVKQFGADSLLARTAGTIYGSTETTFYVLAVYFGSVGIRKTRYALIAGLAADAVAIIASVILCRLLFG